MPQTEREAERAAALAALAGAAGVAVPLNAAQAAALEGLAPFLGAVPERMRGGVIRWLLAGVVPGGFLQALLANDLLDALGRGNDDNLALLPGWGRLIAGGLPRAAHGSRAALVAWADAGGLAARAAGDAAPNAGERTAGERTAAGVGA